MTIKNWVFAPRIGWPVAMLLVASSSLLACQQKEGQSSFPTADVTDFAKAFGADVVLSKGKDGQDIAEVRTAAGTLRQENLNGKLSTTEIDPELDFDQLAKQPGAIVIRHHDGNGDEVIEFRRGGVVITQTRRVKSVSTSTALEVKDDDYHSAILCDRLLLIVDLVDLNACYPHSHNDLRQELIRDIDETSKFIAENSLYPLTVEQSRFLTARIMRSYTAPLSAASAEKIQQSCQSGEPRRNLRDLFRNTPTPEKLRTFVDNSLRIPRPPMMCSGL